MVERAGCSNETGATLNGVPRGVHEGGIPAIAKEDTEGREASDTSATLGRSNGRFSLFKWFKRAGNRDGNRDGTVDKQRERKLNTGKTEIEYRNGRRRSIRSSIESVDTFYSTTTVRSFAFQAGTFGRCDALSFDILKQAAEVGPFAAGASKIVIGNKENVSDVACTLPTNVHSHRRDLTARYSLQPFTTFNSCGNLPDRRFSGSLRRFEERGRAVCNGNPRRRVHVKGKRRAPDPPRVSITIAEIDANCIPKNSNRRKRRAPRPPETIVVEESREKLSASKEDMNVENQQEAEVQSISNDTLVLQGGVLLSKKELWQNAEIVKQVNVGTAEANISQESAIQNIGLGTLNTAMPRPWYKRSVFEHSRDSGSSRRSDILRGPTTSGTEVKEECIGTNLQSSASSSIDASLSRLSFFHRDRTSEDRKREAKRKSGLSILTNISELDKEAAAIVQEEQARARASMLLKSSRLVDALERRNEMNEELVQDMVTSAMENSSPRRGTRALISKFNAISNITKVTVNANFFTRATREQQNAKFERDIVRSTRFDQKYEWDRLGEQATFSQSSDQQKDISRYFLPQQRRSKIKTEAVETETKVEAKMTPRKEHNERLVTETSSRISFLQSQLAGNRMNEPATSVAPVMEEIIRSGQEVPGVEKEKGAKPENEITRRYLPSHTRSVAENTGNMLAVTKVPKQSRPELEVKEFSDIFDEIDKQRSTKEFRFIEKRTADAKAETNDVRNRMILEDDGGISSKVTKVLDILVEAEKDGRSKIPNAKQEKSSLVIDASTSVETKTKGKSNQPKSPLLNRTEDPVTTDLKEMLKEMKHSLPKRSKPQKSSEHPNTTKIEIKEDVPIRTSKISCIIKPMIKTEINIQEENEMDKQKVSSSVQTSGNLRRLNQPSTSIDQPSTSKDQPSTSGWKQNDVIYRSSGTNVAGAVLVKSTFQLIRPRDFAEIEATKTAKGNYKENTYANVIEQSLYANTVVSPSTSSNQRTSALQTVKNTAGRSDEGSPKTSPFIQRKSEVNKEPVKEIEEESPVDRNMNTLAINRLLRKLEAAIASGHHQQAAGLAKELARLKIQCSVIRQRSTRLKDRMIGVNMYIEDKLAHQGPIPLQLPTGMTVAELKTKVQREFEIPTNVQRWIIGKNLADHDEATLDELQAVEGSPVFLYLVAPELRNEYVSQTRETDSVEESGKISDEKQRLETLQAINEEQEEPQDTQEEAAQVGIPEEMKMEEYEELISLENCDVIPNSEPIECPVCFVTYGPREGVILRDCLHMFCRSCLANTIRYCEEAEVKCPYRDAEYTCESTLQEREIKALVEPEIYQQHLAKSIIQAENSAGNNAFHCKTPDCPGWCIYDDDVNNFLCPVCGMNNCLTCQAVHTGKNCKQYQQQLRMAKETDEESRRTAEMLEEMVDRGEALACPKCAVVLMKKWGCDWLRCSMCRTEICWVTKGPRWGPEGRGDTSGGCRCGENGVRCHPCCNYCH